MNKTFKYEVTEEMQINATKEMFFAIYLKKVWIFLLILIAMSISLTVYSRSVDFPIHYIPIGITTLLIILWISVYFKSIQNAKTYFETIDGDKIQTLEINETGLIIELNGNTKKISWNKVDESKQTKNFLILMYKNLPLICIPLKVIVNEIEAIKQQIKSKA